MVDGGLVSVLVDESSWVRAGQFMCMRQGEMSKGE